MSRALHSFAVLFSFAIVIHSPRIASADVPPYPGKPVPKPDKPPEPIPPPTTTPKPTKTNEPAAAPDDSSRPVLPVGGAIALVAGVYVVMRALRREPVNGRSSGSTT